MSQPEQPASDLAARRQEMTAEMERTAFQKKAVSRSSANDTLDDAIAFFTERGYRANRTGRPNQIYVMGGREGKLPRVNAEIRAQENVGKGKVTMLTISGFGELLSTHLESYVQHLRGKRSSN